LPATIDRKVGLGILGLANLLARHGVTYEQFGRALQCVNENGSVVTRAEHIASELRHAINAAAEVARANNMVRAFAIAPTASCSYRSKDLDGFTSTPEIAPPISRSVDRDSGTFGVQTYSYGQVEIASEVGWEAYKRVADEIMIIYYHIGENALREYFIILYNI
jgi:ribonucleotide reductase alpha subunit